MKLPGLAIVGTDTGVGKTAFSRGLLALARRKGLSMTPFKPVESGVGAPSLSPAARSDAELLAEAAQSPESASLYALPLAIAPARAAQRAGVILEPAAMCERARHLSQQGNGILLETAGGLLSPWSGRQGAAELLVTLGLPALVIAADILGTQNHCLLTTEVLASRGIPLVGVVLMGRSADDSIWENAPTLAELYGPRYLGRLPFLSTPTTASFADAIERHLSWPILFETLRPSGEAA